MGGVNTNAYKCVQGGLGGLSKTKNTYFVRRFTENATFNIKTIMIFFFIKSPSHNIGKFFQGIGDI